MIIAMDDLDGLRGRVTMVDGGFDPLHPGHIAYFREAAGLGLPLLCNVASDDWVARKHVPLLSQLERAQLIDALRDVDYTHPSPAATVEILRRLQPRYYVKGADWRDRLPPDEVEACAASGTEIVFVDTVLESSTGILDRYSARDGA